jgi:hypothetical protein
MPFDHWHDLCRGGPKLCNIAALGVILMQGKRLLMSLDLDLLESLVEGRPGSSSAKLV